MSGATVDPALTNRMLNDMGADPDQLPPLQHCLMRMWTEQQAMGGMQFIALTLDEYEKTGGMKYALSNHADEIFNGLDAERKRIAEILFRCLSERSEGKRDTRRPVRLSEPAAVAGLPVEAVAEVVNAFRGRAEKTEKARTKSLFESHLTHASLQARMEDYAAARDILNQTRELDPDMPPDRRHARNLMAWYTELMGGIADKVYERVLKS